MSFELILIFIYKLLNNDIKLWVENDKIKVSIKHGELLQDDDITFINAHKDEILTVLQANYCCSGTYDTFIFKTTSANKLLSFAQERLWFIDQYEEGTNVYNIPMVYSLSTDVDVAVLWQSVLGIVDRHEILRTLIYADENGYSYQASTALGATDLVKKEVVVFTETELDSALYTEVNHIFNLSQEYPLRACFYILTNPKNNVIISRHLSIVIHHIAFDGWSVGVFLKELKEFYRHNTALAKGMVSKLGLPALAIQYKDFALWQREYLTGSKLQEQIAYWKNKLLGYEPLNLIIDKPRPNYVDYSGQDVFFTLDLTVSQNLRSLAKELQVSLYSVLLSAYYLMLHSYTSQDDLVIGSPIANRHYTQIEDLLGFFVNSIVLRIKVEPSILLRDFIKLVGKEVISAQLHQDLPFEKLVEELEVVKDVSRHPIFQVMFGVQTEDSTEIELSNGYIKGYKANTSLYNVAKFDLSTFIDDSQDKLTGVFNYATSLYEEDTIKGFIGTYKEILLQLSCLAIDVKKQTSTRLLDLKYLTEEQFNLVVYDWNKTDKPYPGEKTISQLFEEQVEKTPDSIALVYEDVQLSYRELNNRSNQLAHYLRTNYAINPDTLITLCLDRSEHMLISILAVLKAGGAYVPIDPSYPASRIEYILSDTRTQVLLTNKQYVAQLQQIVNGITDIKLQILAVDDMQVAALLAEASKDNITTLTKSTNLAYVIYTSGTTGQPKGVMIEHAGVVNRICWMQQEYRLSVTDLILQKTPYTFDVSVWELFWANWYGACIVFAKPEGHKDPLYLQDLIVKCRITNIHFVPSMLKAFLSSCVETNFSWRAIDLQNIFCSGEALSLSYAQECHQILPQTKLYNLYGPTEASIDVLHYDCNDQELAAIYIGKQIDNTVAYVLDQNLRPLPIGAIGELYIGGVGLARGYLNREDLTKQRFIANPFQTDFDKQAGKNSRLYKTGDLVRWLADGNLEYIGRNDFQVKIRGYRIELEEIEAILSNYPGVVQSVVAVKEHALEQGHSENKYLVGYYVSEDELAEADVLQYMQAKLPEYMVPNVLMRIAELPLNINGKLDLKALPNPEFTNANTYIAPRNELEQQLCSVWGAVLGLEPSLIGIRDDFFRLGGNSILAIRLINALKKELNLNISIAGIFTNNNIAKLSYYLEHNTANDITINPTTVTKKQEQILSFAQERLWFIDQYEEGTNVYNIPMVYSLSPDVDVAVLWQSILGIVDRHEILRTLIYEDENGYGYQASTALGATDLVKKEVVVFTETELDSALYTEVNHIFNLSQEYPLRACFYILTNPKNNVIISRHLSIVIHHIAFDGWSVGVFLKELKEFYRHNTALAKGMVSKLGLPALAIQYKDFALWQREYLTGSKLQEQIAYWKNKLLGYEPLNLIIDKPRPNYVDYSGQDVFFTLDLTVSQNLRSLAKELQVSLYSVLLSAYYLMLHSYTSQDDLVIGSPIANRHYTQIEDLLGFFVNSIVLRIKVEPSILLRDFIKLVGKEVISAQLHQDLPFEKLVEELEVVKDVSRHPIFQVMFGVQTEDSTEIELSNGYIKGYKANTSLYNVAKFDLSTFIDDSQDKLTGVFNYATSLYEEDTIKGFIGTYKEILLQLSCLAIDVKKQTSTRLLDLKYLTEEQFNLVVYDWNKTDKPYPGEKTISQLFEEQVEKTPDSIALVYEDVQLSYRELNNRSNQLAHYLRTNYAINPDTLITLCLDRSEHMLISILAVLKAGGAYVPIDPSYPDSRIEYILSDTRTQVLLTNRQYVAQLQQIVNGITDSKLQILAVDDIQVSSLLAEASKDNITTLTKSTNLAYVIYTSGTTGKPKGVMIEHAGVVNSICAAIQHREIMIDSHILNTASYVFDSSILEFFPGLFVGASLFMLAENLRKDIYTLLEYSNQQKITNLFLTARLSESFFNTPYNNLSLVNLVLAGEKLTTIKQSKFNIINEYGPTEGSICTSKFKITNVLTSIPIGTPIANTTCYVLDKSLKPLPIGAIGELYIGGVGLARGYLNREDLTKERFIANPFQTDVEKQASKNSRLYKTGDLVRWLADGNLEYIGRNDFQVKIRGYRIELEEIEAVLSNYPGVVQSVVAVKEHALEHGHSENKYLVGYYVSGDELVETDVLQYMQAKLPEYMVPNVLMRIAELPLNINGKLDLKALPNPEFTNANTYIAPRNELEQQLCSVWGAVLGLEPSLIGIRDDFFRLGGDSIISIQLVSRLRQQLQIKVSMKDIFTYKTIENIVTFVCNKNLPAAFSVKTEQGLLTGAVPLLPIQKWFFMNNFCDPNHWNQSFIIKTPNLALSILQHAVIKLCEHHDSLRLRYRKTVGGEYIQYYTAETLPKINILDLKTLQHNNADLGAAAKLHNIFTSWQNTFDLEHGPLFSIGYIYGYADGSARIFFALHHLIVDAVSWRILTEDLQGLYDGKELSAKGSSYRQWAEVIDNYQNNFATELQYWHNVLAQQSKQKQDWLTKNITETFIYIDISLDTNKTKQLLQNSNRAYNTQVNDLLLTAFGYAIANLSGTNKNDIVLEGHGREEIDENIDFTRTVGWFTTIYPVSLEITAELSDSIKSIKEGLRHIPHKGLGYGALIGYGSAELLPRISFNYLGQFEQAQPGTSNRTWVIVDEDSGKTVSTLNNDQNIINVNGLIIDGKLKFNIASKLNSSITESFAVIFKQKLEEIISHCSNMSRTYLTSSDLDNIISQAYLDKLQTEKEIDGVYLANSLQQGFIYHALNQGEIDDAYRVQVVWEYGNILDIDKLKQAWEFAQKKFSSLRLRFAWEAELVQIIDKACNLDWRYVDLTELDAQNITTEIAAIKKLDREEVYNLAQGNLFRVYLIKQAKDLYTCIFSNHHAILDGWSCPILFDYVHKTYATLLANVQILCRQEQSYVLAQKYLQHFRDEHKTYWEQYIDQLTEKSDLSGLLISKNKTQALISEHHYISAPAKEELIIQGQLYSNLKILSQTAGVTANAILQYIWHKILSIYGNTKQTIVGTTISGRNIPLDDIENSVGLYINTLPLIVNHAADLNIISELQLLQSNINELNSRGNINLSEIQKRGERLFDSLFIYENYPSTTNEKAYADLKIKFIEAIEKLDYPLAVMGYESNSCLYFEIQYAGELFSRATVLEVLQMAETLLQQIVNDPSAISNNLRVLNDLSFQTLVYDWNKTEKPYPWEKTIPQLFEEQVEKTPDNIALVYEDVQLSYRELNNRSNQLAHYLRTNYAINPDTLITLCLDRSEHMLIAILAVLKAGGAYVPIDPSYPASRIEYILSDTRTQVLLTNKQYVAQLQQIVNGITDIKLQILAVDDMQVAALLAEASKDNITTLTKSTNLAYVIYTSGTTGQPKGVMIEHAGVVNRICWMQQEYRLSVTDLILQKTPYTFDVSVWELFWANWYGACIVFAKPEGHKDPLYLQDLIVKCRITNIHFVPSMLKAFLSSCVETNFSWRAIDLQNIFCSGEALSLSYAQECHQILPQTKLYNLYGPTEASIDVLHYDCNDQELAAIYIGKQIDNTVAYVLDQNLRPLPIGAIGELYIGGVGLARGYLNREDLTKQRFITNPFQTDFDKQAGKNSRLYKTGDLVRWLADGNLEYIGRNDFQVKIRGYRIELEEIEAILSNYPGVVQSVVAVKEHALEQGHSENKYLVGYYVSEDELVEADVLQYMQAKLPEYMVPNVLMRIAELPLNINGKLDLKALPNPEFTNANTYIAPRNELEQQLCSVWGAVLGLEPSLIGIRDDFFRLGGNSILAIRLINALKKELNLNISIAAIFTNNNIAKLSYYLEHNTANDITINPTTVTKKQEQILSFAQERLWFIDQYEEGTNVYNIPMVYSLSPDVDVAVLWQSILGIVDRHEILRTLIYEDENGYGYQASTALGATDLVKKEVVVFTETELDSALYTEVNHIFNLSQEYPLRACFYILTNPKNNVIISRHLSIVIHHIAFDGWSVGVFLKELKEFYRHNTALAKGMVSKLGLPALAIQYKDFALWQREYLTGSKLQEQIAYWKNKLLGYEPLNLIIDKPRPNYVDYSGQDVFFTLDLTVSQNLRSLAKELQVSLYSVLLSAYYLMLHSYTSQDDLVIGSPIANRHYTQIEDLLGFFVNSIVLRIKVEPSILLRDFIKLVGKEVISAQLHQDLPFEKLVEELEVVKDVSRHPIFQVMFGVQTEDSTEIELSNGYIKGYKANTSLYNVAKFDLSTFIDDSQDKLTGVFNYATSLYEEDTIKGFIGTYKEILLQLSCLAIDVKKQTSTRLLDLKYLTEEQFNLVVYDWNKTEKPYPWEKTITQLFEEQVEKTPDSIALVYEDVQLSYRELNNRSNQLAHYLRGNYAINPDTLITLCLDRSEHMLISILAVLKAGGAYVPIDPSYPASRIEYILSDTRTQVLLTNKQYVAQLQQIANGITDSKLQILAVDDIQVAVLLAEASKDNITTLTKSTNLAYVIYTSGTTGQPKGVMIEHAGVVNLLFSINIDDFFANSPKVKCFLWYANYTFDAHVWEVYMSIISNGRLYIINNDFRKNPELLRDYVSANKINIALLPPAILSNKNILNFDSLLVGGDKISQNILEHYLQNGIKTLNAYGPTEATVYVTLNYNYYKNTTIGTPIANTTCYVLDQSLRPLPAGAIGELYIGGVGLARGYLNREDLTKQRFIANTFQTDVEKQAGKNCRFYKTGDLVRWLADGNLEYIGRNDFQVKIRGYRIELEEIEAILSNYPGVVQSVVEVKEHTLGQGHNENKYLVGYYVSGNELVEADVLQYMQAKLPEYMVPNVLVRLAELPLNINGKLDRKALPNPEFTNANTYIAPRNELEQQLCGVWGDVLGLEPSLIGIRDDFFRLGGDSIVSIQLVSRLRQQLQLKISMKDIFTYKTIENIVASVCNKNLSASITIKTEQGLLTGAVPLLPIQKWFFANDFCDPNHWNQSFIIKTPNLELSILKQAVIKLYEHHDSLRLRYRKNDSGEYIQYYTAQTTSQINVLDVKSLNLDERGTEFAIQLQDIFTSWQNTFDLEHGPLCSVGYIHGYADGSARIFFALHHLIVDAVSWRILTEDLQALYDGKELPAKGSSYRQWAEVIDNYKNNFATEPQYWQNVLAQQFQQKQDWLTKNIAATTTYIDISLDSKKTKQLLQNCNRAYNTQVNDLLLTAFAYAIAKISSHNINYIVLEGHGREEIDESIDLTRTVGWFTTIYPVSLAITAELSDSIKNIKESLRHIPHKGLGYGALIGYGKDIFLPQISFNYLGQFEKEQSGKSQGLWTIVDEHSGRSVAGLNRDQNIINVNGLIIDGKLSFNIASKLDVAQTEALAQTLKQKLEVIIEHCINKKIFVNTMSDYSDYEIYSIYNAETKPEAKAIFMLPPGDGGFESYLRNLVPKLQDKKLVLFNNYYFYLKNKFNVKNINDITYEKLASEYVIYIKLIQPSSPYNLFGWSSGGILAFEIARQLCQMGEHVQNLILVDPFFNFKKAILNTQTELHEINNIDYKYQPIVNILEFNANIVLFKALECSNSKLEPNCLGDLKGLNIQKIYQYYTKHTDYNHLDDFVDRDKIKIIGLEGNHDLWIKNEIQVAKICAELVKNNTLLHE